MSPDPSFWRGRRVLLTGHTGFKGGWAALWLRDMGAEVTGFALPPETEPSLFAMLGDAAGASVLGDLRDRAAVADAVERARPEIVLHMAAQPLVRLSYAEPVETFDVNVMGTVHLLDALRRADEVRAILVVTSDKVYDNDESGRAFAEGDRLGGHDPYAASKAAAEIVAASFARSFFVPGGVALATARGGNVIGGGDFAADRLVPDVVRAALAGEAVRLRNPGATRPWQHVLDCIAGYLVYLQALAAGRAVPPALNFGPPGGQAATGDAPSVAELAAAMCEAMEAPPPTDEADAGPREMRALALDPGLAATALGWRGRIGAAEAVRLTADWYAAWRRGAEMERFTRDQIRAYAEARRMSAAPACRYCNAPLSLELVDLGATPLANSYLPPTPEAVAAERSFPLRVMVCRSCRLAQTTETVPAEAIFAHDYAYLSSYSASWVAHARRYAEAMIARFGLTRRSLVAEVASNDGYLLQHFVAAGIPVLGIEPAGHAAGLAEARGVPTRVAFFGRALGRALAAEGRRADLIAANNVLAHVPDIRDFAAGFAEWLAPEGVATFEFPHLLNLLKLVQFDTIYHEHYSYLSLLFVERLLGAVGLRAFDAERLPTHGGSLRVLACHAGARHAEGARLAEVRAAEAAEGLDSDAAYAAFGPRVRAVCDGFRAFLDRAAAAGAAVAGYGAAAKGNTFLNVCGVGARQVGFVADRNPGKQGKLLPGSHIPVLSPEALDQRRPRYVVILPWNIADEVVAEHARIAGWGGRFVTAVPELRVL